MALVCSLVLSGTILVTPAFLGTSEAASAHRPDAWIKLCGYRNTCLAQAWHPWFGDNVHNATGRNQNVLGVVEEGTMIRFWVLLSNDGVKRDTLHVKGCAGNKTWPLLSVNVGAWRYFTTAGNVTTGFKKGTAKFSFPPNTTPKRVILTVRFRALATAPGRRYSCPVTVSSGANRTIKDRVVIKMVTI